jgi:hypothetical protein
MLMTTRRRGSAAGRRAALALAALALAAALSPRPAAAETVLVATRETVGGSPCARPLPLEEGLLAALFAAGHIVFAPDGAGDSEGGAGMLRLARASGADWVLEALADYRESRVDRGPARLAARVRWTLLRAGDGSQARTGTLETGNEGRERTVDLAALGAELGTAIALAVVQVLSPAE